MKRHNRLILIYTSGAETLGKGFVHALIRIDHHREKSLIVLRYSRKYRGCVSSLLVRRRVLARSGGRKQGSTRSVRNLNLSLHAF